MRPLLVVAAIMSVSLVTARFGTSVRKMTEDIITVPAEDRVLLIRDESFIITVPAEWRRIGVRETMLIASKQHTAGDTRKWIIDYDRWLDNAASIVSAQVTSSSLTCTIDSSEVKGKEVIFLLTGGNLEENLTVTLKVTDNFQNVKTDSIRFTVIAP
jgi:hypothetical protein